MRFSFLLFLLCLISVACAPTVQSGAPNNFPVRDGQRWFVMAHNEKNDQSFQREIRIQGQPRKLPNGNWVLYFDDQQSFFLLQANSAYLLIRYKANGLNYDSDEAALCQFSTQINPISDDLWAGNGFFGTTNGVIAQANATPVTQSAGYCAMLRR